MLPGKTGITEEEVKLLPSTIEGVMGRLLPGTMEGVTEEEVRLFPRTSDGVSLTSSLG